MIRKHNKTSWGIFIVGAVSIFIWSQQADLNASAKRTEVPPANEAIGLKIVIPTVVETPSDKAVVAESNADPMAAIKPMVSPSPDMLVAASKPEKSLVVIPQTVSAVDSSASSSASAIMVDKPVSVIPSVSVPDNPSLPNTDEVVFSIPTAVAPEAVNTISGTPVNEAYREADTITVDFPDESIRNIIRNVSDLYDLNVVIPESLVGRVSLKLRNVSWKQVFQVVLEPQGFTYVEEGNIIKIKSRSELNLEPVNTRVFIVNNASASELKASVSALIDVEAGGKIEVDSRSNALVITERPSRMNSIQEILDRLDRPTDQVMIESKFIEVTNNDGSNLGVKWNSLNEYNLNASNLSRTYTDSNRTSRDGSLEGSSDVGVNDPAISGVGAYNYSATTAASSITNAIMTGRMDAAVFSGDTFNILIGALQSKNEVKLVSNPTVVTVNNTAAKILVGEQYPVVSPRYNAETGTYEAGDVSKEDLGVKLNVTPSVNSAGFITLKVSPEVSSLAGTVTQFGAEYPRIAKRTTDSVVTIKSGYTLAIGGLLETTVSKDEYKVPLLGSIPFIGRVFRYNSDINETKNLIIFITAKILNPDGSTYNDIFDKRRIFEMGLSNRDVPGLPLTENEERLISSLQSTRDELELLKTEGHLRAQIKQLQANEEMQREANRNSQLDPEKAEASPVRGLRK
jgi:type IV pilus assembly protein PilQ